MAYIAGYSNGCAGHALGSGDVDTVVQGWTTCIDQAGWKADDVDLMYAHGNGTIRFDDIEAMALRRVFADNQPAVTTNKGQIGHTIAAGGPISMACAIASMQASKVPHISNLRQLAPTCVGIDAVQGEPREKRVRRVLIHSAGLGGQTTCIALEYES